MSKIRKKTRKTMFEDQRQFNFVVRVNMAATGCKRYARITAKSKGPMIDLK
jgi:hypothetical protein